jgi:hypothetical protein
MAIIISDKEGFFDYCIDRKLEVGEGILNLGTADFLSFFLASSLHP